MKIIIDPGHGEKGNPYPPMPGFFEGTQMWRLAKFLAEELSAKGFETVLTRQNPADNPGLNERGRMAGNAGASMFLSLHSNAAASPTNTAPTGSEVFYSVRTPQYKPFAGKLASYISKVMGHTSRGAKTRESDNHPGNDFFSVLNSAVRAGCQCAFLLEHGFHTNPSDAKFLSDDNNLKKIAAIEAELIAEFLYGSDAPALTPIMGVSVATAAQITSYIKRVNPYAPDLAELFISEGILEGVRGDIAFAQSCIETGNFTFSGGTAVTLAQNNFCGMGVTSTGMTGNSFATPQLGIRAQIQHLKAYACTEPLNNPNESPRFHFVQRGVAPYVEWLGAQENPQGRGWAMGASYGEKILRVLNNIISQDIMADEDEEEITNTVNNALNVGIINSSEYWLNVLNGEKSAEPGYIKVLMDNANTLISSLKKS